MDEIREVGLSNCSQVMCSQVMCSLCQRKEQAIEFVLSGVMLSMGQYREPALWFDRFLLSQVN